MSRDLVNSICGGFPGAELSDSWDGGHDCWKVGGRIFAVTGARLPGVSVKTDGVERAEMLIAAGVAERAPYLHRSWVRLPESCPKEELRHRLGASYRIVRAGLPRAARATLDREA